MIVRATIANIAPQEAVDLLREAGLSATLYDSVGFTPEWGAERGTTIEFVANGTAESVRFQAFVRATLRLRNESAAYVTVDGRRAYLLWADASKPDETLA